MTVFTAFIVAFIIGIAGVNSIAAITSNSSFATEVTATTDSYSYFSQAGAEYYEHFNATDFLLSKCRLSPNINSPEEQRNKTTKVDVRIEIDRFLHISDVDEYFEYSGILSYSWFVPCVAAAANSPEWPATLNKMPNIADGYKYWRPSMAHRNSINDILLKKEVSNWMNILPKLGLFVAIQVGRFTSYCDLDLYSFPFDEQTCQVTFIMLYPTDFVEITNVGYILSVTDDYMGENSGWEYVSNYTSISEVNVMPIGQFSTANYFLTFRRRPQYYIWNLLGPSVVINVLLMAMFLIPAHAPDRATYAVTLMLSAFVLQAQILANMPKTPKDIVITGYVLACIIYGMICALHAGAMCCLTNVFREQAERRIILPKLFCFKPRKVQLSNLIDVLSFYIVFLIYGIINAVGFTAAFA